MKSEVSGLDFDSFTRHQSSRMVGGGTRGELKSAVDLSIIVCVCGTPRLRLKAYMAVYWQNGSWVCSQVKERPFVSALCRRGWGSAGQVEDQGGETQFQNFTGGERSKTHCTFPRTSYSSLEPMWSFSLSPRKCSGNFAAGIALKHTRRHSPCSADDVRCRTRTRNGLTLAFPPTVWCHCRTTLSCCGKEQTVFEHIYGEDVSHRGRTNLMTRDRL